MKLDIGCGFNKEDGYTGIDKQDRDGVDIVHDLEVFPWPIETESCEHIVASHIAEHIKPWLQMDFMNECWRVLKPGGQLQLNVPYANTHGEVQDPTHCTSFNELTWFYYDPKYKFYEMYQPKPWECTEQTTLRELIAGRATGDIQALNHIMTKI